MEVGFMVACAPDFRSKARYVLETLLATMGAPFRPVENPAVLAPGHPLLYYGPQELLPHILELSAGPLLAILADEGGAGYFRGRRSYPRARVKTFRQKSFGEVPVLFYSPYFASGGSWHEDLGPFGVSLHVDLVASAFYFLSCWQEYTDPVRDSLDRFPYERSIHKALRLVKRPLVNEYLEIIKEWLAKITGSFGRQIGWLPSWPKGKTFAVALTHDIDQIRKWRLGTFHREFRALARILAAGKGMEGARRTGKLMAYLARCRDPYWVYDLITKEEEKHNCTSSFYFLGGRSDPAFDQGYGLGSRRGRRLVARLAAKGVEIGLHGSFASYREPLLLAEEKLRLVSLAGEITGGRQHYLRLAWPVTFRYLEEAGLDYDSTLGFAEYPGFRASFAYPFFPYDPDRDRPFRVLEIPLVIMDTTLEGYQGMGAREGGLVLMEYLGILARYGGCGALLWHNGYFDELDFPGYGELYWQALDWLNRQGGWGASGREINNWWRRRISALASP